MYYLCVFMCGVFLGKLSVIFTFWLLMERYKIDLADRNFMLPMLAVIMLYSLGDMLIARGRAQWVWCSVAVLLTCLVNSLLMARYAYGTLTWFLAMTFPLLGLLVLNSDAHLILRQKKIEERRSRELIWRSLKAHEKDKAA